MQAEACRDRRIGPYDLEQAEENQVAGSRPGDRGDPDIAITLPHMTDHRPRYWWCSYTFMMEPASPGVPIPRGPLLQDREDAGDISLDEVRAIDQWRDEKGLPGMSLGSVDPTGTWTVTA